MKKQLLFLGAIVFTCFEATAQCLTVSCPSSISTVNDAGSCGAVVNYTTPAMNSTCVGAIADTFHYTGAIQTYVVPAGVTTLTLETWGAQGGANWVNNVNFGGYVKGDFSVTPGETIYIYVGQQPNGITGGYNGGGNGEGAGQGGGGGTDIRQGGTSLNNRIIVAGGGGGAGYWSNLHVVGGVGGGTTGGNGYRDPDFASNPGGEGGNQFSSGTGTCVNYNVPATAGGFGYGGTPSGCGCEGYGGGGGWYGGAASGNCRGGGGGSGYLLPIAANPNMQAGIRVGNGMAVVSYNGAANPSMTQTAGLPSGSVFPVGITTNTFTASDAFGNTNNCSFQVTVTDNETPVISALPSSMIMPNDPAQCGATVNWTTPSATDNCTATLSSNHNSGDVFPIGTTTVTYIATDPSGNAGTSSFTVTVNDTEVPVITGTPSAIIMSNDAGQCGAVVNWTAPSASDNCAAMLTANHNPADFFPIGTTTVMYIATDPSGNADTTTFSVTVNDTELPVLTCPSAITLNAAPASCSVSSSLIGIAAATDNCTIAGSATNDAPSLLSVGTTLVTWTATDVNGNVANCTQSVTVVDAEAPVFSSVPADDDACEGIYTFNAPTATDNCSQATVVQTGINSGDMLTAGTYTITYTATDTSGNSSSASFTVTVHANPTVALNLTMAATVCLDDANYTLAGGTPAGGSWSGNGVSGSSFDPSAAGAGLQHITYTFTDANGCFATANDSVTVSLCTGINEQGLATFSLFPNPASGSFWFTSAENGNFELLDLNGQLIQQEQINSRRQEINIGNIAEGVYLVRFTSPKGISTARLIIQK